MSKLESLLTLQIKTIGLPEPEREFRFHPQYRWRFDFAWPVMKIAAEIEGGHWIQGRHTRGQGFAADCKKYNEAALLGWRVFRFTADMVYDGDAFAMLEKALRGDKMDELP